MSGVRVAASDVRVAATPSDTIHYQIASLHQFALGANVPLYVMATGYDRDIVPSGIIFQCSVIL